MHRYVVSDSVKNRVIGRMGKLLANETIEGGRTALLVVDMQNYYCAAGFPLEVPMAREIVQNLNRLARAVRSAGGLVIWLQMTAVGSLDRWSNYHHRMLSPERQQKRLAGLDEASEGFQLLAGLEAIEDDLRIRKSKYSAFAPKSSNLDQQLKARGIDTLLVSGTLTNVCCESTARDAMQLDYKVIMLSDGTATLSEEEHSAALNTFMLFFGDVMSTEEAIARLGNRQNADSV
jgi:ureidoacrylate peracid hydrolase